MKDYKNFINENLDPTARLINGVRDGDLDMVIDAIRDGADVNHQTAVMLSYRGDKNNVEILDAMVNAGMNIHCSDDMVLKWPFTMGNSTSSGMARNIDELSDPNKRIVKYFLTYIMENEPENIEKYLKYLPKNDEEFMDKYPWIYAGEDHGLLGLQKINIK